MRKIPIELFGLRSEDLQSGDVEPRSPIVWNGLEFSVCSELPYSIFSTVMRDAKELNLSVTHQLFKTGISLHTSKAIISDLRDWYRDNNKTVLELAKISYQTKDSNDAATNDLVNLFHSNEKLKLNLIDTESVFAKIKNGTLLSGNRGYIVKFNKKTFTYSISRRLVPAPNFIGDQSVRITKIDNTVKIDFDPAASFKINAGVGFFAKIYEYYDTLNVASIVTGTKGIIVSETLDNFTVSASENLVLSKSSNLKINYDLNLGFKIYLDSTFKYQLNFKLFQGYGVEINYNAATLKYDVTTSNISTKFVSGRGATVTQIVSMGKPTNSYHVDFLVSTMPQYPKVEAEVKADTPINSSVTYGVTSDGRGQLICDLNMTVDPDSGLVDRIKNINRSLINTDTLLSTITLDSLSSDTKTALRCPILNLFRVATSDTISSTAASRISPEIADLVSVFGISSKYLEVPVDISRLMNTNVFGDGTLIGTTFKFNAYRVLEDYLKRRLASPVFKINSLDIGTRFIFVDANLDNTYFSPKSEQEMLPLSYNMGWEETSDKTDIGTPILFSAADYDFFVGISRNGQLNTRMADFNLIEQNELSDLKFGYTIVSNVVVDTATTKTYTIKIQDYAKEHTVVWRRPLVAVKSSMDTMTELSDKLYIPPKIRLIARLIAEWGYSMLDVQKTIRGMYVQKSKIDGGVSPIFFDRLSDPDYFKSLNLEETLGEVDAIVQDPTTGDITLKIKAMRKNMAVASIDSVFSAIRTVIKFRLQPLSSEEYQYIEGDCNYDFTNYDIGKTCSSYAAPSVRKVDYFQGNAALRSELTVM